MTNQPENTETGRNGGHRAIVLAVLFLIGLLVRLYGIGEASLWLDEILQVNFVSGNLGGVWGRTSLDRTPLDGLIQWCFLQLGEHEGWVRLHAALLGAAFVPAVAAWAWQMGGRRLAIVSGVLVLFWPIHVRFSQEGSMYSLSMFSLALFYLCLWRVVWRRGEASMRDWIALALATSLAQHASLHNWFPIAFAVVACGVYAAALRWRGYVVEGPRRGQLQRDTPADGFKRWLGGRRMAGALAFVIICVIAGMPLLIRQLSLTGFVAYAGWNAQDSWHFVSLYLDIYALGYDWYHYTPRWGWCLAGVVGVGVGWVLARLQTFPALFLLGAGPGMFFFAFFIMWLTDHWMEVRYTLICFPAVVVLSAFGIEAIGALFALPWRREATKREAVRSWASVALAVAVAAIQLHHVVRDPVKRSGWRELVQFLGAHAEKDAAVLVAEPLDVIPLEYYSKQQGQAFNLVSLDRSVDRLRELMAAPQPVWFVLREDIRYTDLGKEAEALLHLQPAKADLLYVFATQPSENAVPEGLQEVALSASNPKITITPGDAESPHVGIGWYVPESWGEDRVRALGPVPGELLVSLQDVPPGGLSILVHTVAFEPHREPALRLRLAVLGEEYPASQESELSFLQQFNVSAHSLRPGLNRFLLVPSRRISPVELDPASTDKRLLSFWIRAVEVEWKQSPEAGIRP